MNTIHPTSELLRIAKALLAEDIAPRISKVETLPDGTAVWLVDGNSLRTKLDEEFTNFGHHWLKDYIPEDEFWIDREAAPNEYDFFVAHLQKEAELMKGGKSYNEAITEADKVEAVMRRQQGDVKKLIDQHRGVLDTKLAHKRLWKKLENGIEVWIINGRLIRSIYTDFTAGGHPHVYEWVPSANGSGADEIWIDDDIMPEERGFVLLHELHEYNLMEKGWPYSKAHNDSSRVESRCRQNPDELHDALSAEGWT